MTNEIYLHTSSVLKYRRKRDLLINCDNIEKLKKLKTISVKNLKCDDVSTFNYIRSLSKHDVDGSEDVI